jgi:hypothetical protein
MFVVDICHLAEMMAMTCGVSVCSGIYGKLRWWNRERGAGEKQVLVEKSGRDAGLFFAVREDGKSLLRNPAGMPVCSSPSGRTARVC